MRVDADWEDKDEDAHLPTYAELAKCRGGLLGYMLYDERREGTELV